MGVYGFLELTMERLSQIGLRGQTQYVPGQNR
jgi:hypothetical protein